MSRAEQLIYQRRAQEQKLSNMQTKLKQEFHQQEFAKWQNKGKNIELHNQVKARLNQARAESQANLQIRRYGIGDVGKNWRPCLEMMRKIIKGRLWPVRKLLSRSGRKWLHESRSSRLKNSREGSKR